MDLWIRNQDKTILKKVSRLSLSAFNGDVLVDGEYFGTYKTKKRALEVLNEIQKYVDEKPIIKLERMYNYQEKLKEFGSGFIITDSTMEIVPAKTKVYEMPKE